jgi:MoaA/NifB/PqqE/SkfB family radical SAM enzyme
VNPVISQMPVLVLNPHNRCNCRCVMCDIWKRDEAQEISADFLAAQLESIRRLGVKWVVLTGGEPLMHSHLFQLCDLLRSCNVRVTLLSSGLLLDRYAEQIAANIDDVIVSLDGPPAIHDRIRRVDGAFSLLQKGIVHLQARGIAVAARCTVQSDNASFLLDTLRTARELGLASISFLAADLTSDAFNRKPGTAPDLVPDHGVLANQIEQLIATGECEGFILESAAKLRRIADHFTNPSAPMCNAPWVSAVMDTDGAVRPCFFHKPVGRVGNGSTLYDVVNGPEAIAFRSSLDVASNPICRQCVCSLNMPLPH